MTSFRATPCMQNNTVSREDLDIQIAQLEQLIADYEENPESNTLHLHQKLRALKREQHPDDWFIDPGSGRETEDGRRRRRAIQACWADCPMKERLLCLDRGLQEGATLQYGIYGGYTEKQRQAIVDEIAERKKMAPDSTR